MKSALSRGRVSKLCINRFKNLKYHVALSRDSMNGRILVFILVVSILTISIYSSSINFVTAKVNPTDDQLFACSSSHSTPNVVKCTFTMDGKSTGFNCVEDPNQKLSCVNDAGTGTGTLAKGNLQKKFHDLLMQIIQNLR